MNTYQFLLRFVLSLIGATGASLIISITVLSILKYIVYFFNLNYGRDVYWVLNFTTFVFYITWILTFAYYINY